MNGTEKRPLSLKRALGLSAGLHLLAAPLFVVLPGFVATAPSFETREPSEVIHISSAHRASSQPLALAPHPARRRAPAAAAPGEPKAQARAALPPVAVPAIARDASAQRTTAALFEHETAPRPAPVRKAALVVAEVGDHGVTTEETAAAAAPAVAPAEEPQEQSSAPPAANSGRDYGVPAGGWGQNFDKPLVADESALSDLRARYHGSASVTVLVDEDGHATKVIVSDALPSDARDEIARLLLSLRYVPAECNGLHCSGTLQLTL